jgi:LysM domain
VLLDPKVRTVLVWLSFGVIAAILFLARDKALWGQWFNPELSTGRELRTATDRPRDEALVYKVQPGDEWWKIAQAHSISTRALLEANGANVGTPLVTGQNIRLPGGTPAAARGPGSAF